jgi:hypothetical protein
VRLPVRLPAGHRETWSRLLHAHVATLEAYRGNPDPPLDVAIEEEGEAVPASPVTAGARCAVAFSGGKDSLLHAGLLSEWTERPLLVPTTSPMPGHGDHATDRRRAVLSEVGRRRDVEVLEVESDFRSSWVNGFSRRLGYGSVNESTDAHLYAASLLVVGAARGAGRLFLASENEVSETARFGGWVVGHPHSMYGAPAQATVQALLAPSGLRYSSLAYALHSHQVQELLWTRYPELRSLQYSCWKVSGRDTACSRCSQCLRLAMGALHLDDDPSLLGVDLSRALRANRAWDPRKPPPDGPARALPQYAVARRLRGILARYLESVPEERVRARLEAGPAREPSPLRRWLARRAFRRLRRRVAGHDFGPRPGFRRGYLALSDPSLSARAGDLFAKSFPEEDPAAYAEGLGRVRELTAWTTAPLASP